MHASDPGIAPAEVHSSDEVVARALAAQPGFEALRTRARALRSEAAAARVDRPDPMVMGTLWVDTFGTMEPGRVRTMLEASQTLPGRARREAAAGPIEARAEAAAAEEALAALALARDVRQALLARERVAALHEAWALQDALLADLEALLAATMPVGRGSYADLLALAVAREEIASRLDRLQGEADAADGQLHALLLLDLREHQAPFQLQAEDALLTVVELPSPEALIEASRAHPVFAVAEVEREVAAAEHEALQVARRPVPTVTVGVGSMPMVNEGTGMMVMAGVGMPIPVFGAATAYRQEAAALRAEAAGGQAAGQHVELDAGIRAAVARHREAGRRIERLEERLMPLADDAIDRLVADIETGRSTYADVLRAVAQREALVVQGVEARFDALAAQVAIAALVGRTLEEVGQ